MAYAQVQTTGPTIAIATSITRSFGVLPSAGDLIVVNCGGFTSGTILVSDNQGNTYHQAVRTSSFGYSTAIWYAFNIGAPAGTFTITIADVIAGYLWGDAFEYSGFVSANDPLFTTAGNGFSANPLVLTGAIPTLNPDCVVFSGNAMYNGGSCSVNAAVPAWTTDYNYGGFNGAGASRINNVAGNQSIQWNLSGTNAGGVLAVFQEPTDFTTPRTSQIAQSVVATDTTAVRTSQIVRSFLPGGNSRVRTSQIVMTLIVTPPGPQPNPPPPAGCPAGTSLEPTPVSSDDGCADEV